MYPVRALLLEDEVSMAIVASTSHNFVIRPGPCLGRDRANAYHDRGFREPVRTVDTLQFFLSPFGLNDDELKG